MQPEDMSRWARNERLYLTLMQRGLVVQPLKSSIRKDGIEFMLVSSDLIDLSLSEKSITFGGVIGPVEGLKVT